MLWILQGTFFQVDDKPKKCTFLIEYLTYVAANETVFVKLQIHVRWPHRVIQ